MIQYYINSRPVPRAIARQRLWDSRPVLTYKMVDWILTRAKNGEPTSIEICADAGVSVAKL